MTVHDDLDKELSTYLREGPTELPYESFDAVRDRMEQTSQRAVLGPWRLPDMNKIVTFGLAAAAVVAAVFIGVQIFGSPDGGLGSQATPTPEATADPTPSPSAAGGIPVGPYVVEDGMSDAEITVSIPEAGWGFEPAFSFLYKEAENNTGILVWPEAQGQTFYVPGDPCQWEATMPETPVTTADEFAAALAAQASRDASTPVDVMIDGYAGKSVTLHVPPDADFAECDEDTFGSWWLTETENARSQQEPGQIDEIWILDVEGSVVILDASYFPDTPGELVGEIRAIVDSATIEVP
jgi:hypothetical protein